MAAINVSVLIDFFLNILIYRQTISIALFRCIIILAEFFFITVLIFTLHNIIQDI
jgi:hypothetical protein